MAAVRSEYWAALEQQERTMRQLALDTKAELQVLWEKMHAHNAEIRVQNTQLLRLDREIAPFLQGPDALHVRFQKLSSTIEALNDEFEEIRDQLRVTLVQTQETCAKEIQQFRREREQEREQMKKEREDAGELYKAKLSTIEKVAVALISACAGVLGAILKEWLQR